MISSSHNTIRSKLLYHAIQHTWLWSGLASVYITLILFSLMPGLQKPIGERSAKKKPAAKVKVIHVQQPDTPVRFKEPDLQKPAPQKLRPLPRAERSKMEMHNLRPGFDSILKLDSEPYTIKIPAMTHAAICDLELPKIFNAGDLDQQLITLTRKPPVYPIYAKRNRIQGYVKTQFVIDIHGSVNDVIIIESNPPDVFDQSVIDCISEWHFIPGTVGGKPANTLAETTVSFKLEQNE